VAADFDADESDLSAAELDFSDELDFSEEPDLSLELELDASLSDDELDLAEPLDELFADSRLSLR
jgi:hypothetical protein